MILSYDDDEYFINQQNQEDLESDYNKKLKEYENQKRKQLQENLFAFDSKKHNVNIFAGDLKEKDQNFDDEFLKKISEMKIKQNQDIVSISAGNPNESESFTLGSDKFLTKDMLRIIDSPSIVIIYYYSYYYYYSIFFIQAYSSFFLGCYFQVTK